MTVWLALLVGLAIGELAGIITIPTLDYLAARRLRALRLARPNVIDLAHVRAAKRGGKARS